MVFIYSVATCCRFLSLLGKLPREIAHPLPLQGTGVERDQPCICVLDFWVDFV
jgi:hypothetical protein